MKETPTMALTKSHLIDTIAEQNGFTRKKAISQNWGGLQQIDACSQFQKRFE